ncbi:MAG: hypothetical protein ACRD2B_12605, partial [Terriglobia bacterium]
GCRSEELLMALCDTPKHENYPSPALLRRAPSPLGEGYSSRLLNPLPRGEGGERREPGEGSRAQIF